MDWDTTKDFGAGVQDGSIAAHEIGEWMDDPLGTNPTPAWGAIGQQTGCQRNLENGDPLSGKLMPAYVLGGEVVSHAGIGVLRLVLQRSVHGIARSGREVLEQSHVPRTRKDLSSRRNVLARGQGRFTRSSFTSGLAGLVPAVR
jgi:hypothetical protein